MPKSGPTDEISPCRTTLDSKFSGSAQMPFADFFAKEPPCLRPRRGLSRARDSGWLRPSARKAASGSKSSSRQWRSVRRSAAVSDSCQPSALLLFLGCAATGEGGQCFAEAASEPRQAPAKSGQALRHRAAATETKAGQTFGKLAGSRRRPWPARSFRGSAGRPPRHRACLRGRRPCRRTS